MRPFAEFPSMVAIDRFDCNDENETVLYRQLFVYTYALYSRFDCIYNINLVPINFYISHNNMLSFFIRLNNIHWW